MKLEKLDVFNIGGNKYWRKCFTSAPPFSFHNQYANKL